MSQGGHVIWFTGLPASGKTTLAVSVAEALSSCGINHCLLDSDQLRRAFVPAHDYSDAGRDAFYETVSNLAALLADQGLVVLVAATAHLRRFRERARDKACRFTEVYVATSLDECQSRDPKGLYRERPDRLPGMGVAYEPPANAELVAEHGSDPTVVAEIVALCQAARSSAS